jgi:hypothetical protein
MGCVQYSKGTTMSPRTGYMQNQNGNQGASKAKRIQGEACTSPRSASRPKLSWGHRTRPRFNRQEKKGPTPSITRWQGPSSEVCIIERGCHAEHRVPAGVLVRQRMRVLRPGGHATGSIPDMACPSWHRPGIREVDDVQPARSKRVPPPGDHR